jgi:hypothetical protein
VDRSIIEAVARKNVARFRELLNSCTDEQERYGLLKLLADEQRKLLQVQHDSEAAI